MRYLIADIITEFSPKYEYLTRFSKPFLYRGENASQIKLALEGQFFSEICDKMNQNIGKDRCESYAYSCLFSREIINFGGILLHSSSLKLGDKSYLFLAPSGTGKSTHTSLWKKAFGSAVEMMNDDKTAVRKVNEVFYAYSTPFDGGSGVANNISAPIGGIVFIERGSENSVRKASQNEIISRIYSSFSGYKSYYNAHKLLSNIESLILSCDFYNLTCNTDISAAYIAYEAIVK